MAARRHQRQGPAHARCPSTGSTSRPCSTWSRNKLTATTNLKITGAAEDPNRLVEYRGVDDRRDGQPCRCATGARSPRPISCSIALPPIAELSLGLTWTPIPKLSVRATVYNALFGHYYQPDVFFDYEPHLEYLPNPYEGFRAYVTALLQY